MTRFDEMNYDGIQLPLFDVEITEFGPGEMTRTIVVTEILRPNSKLAYSVVSGDNFLVDENGKPLRLTKQEELRLLYTGFRLVQQDGRKDEER